jgi:hypothetical protein
MNTDETKHITFTQLTLYYLMPVALILLAMVNVAARHPL